MIKLVKLLHLLHFLVGFQEVLKSPNKDFTLQTGIAIADAEEIDAADAVDAKAYLLKFTVGLSDAKFCQVFTSQVFLYKMSIEEGLISTDVEVLKLSRGIAKGKVTKAVKALRLSLASNAEGVFLFDEINAAKVEENFSKLEKSYDDFSEIHERLSACRASGGDDEQDKSTKDEDDAYSNEISKEYSSTVRRYNKFKKIIDDRLSSTSKAREIAELADDVASLKISLACNDTPCILKQR